MYLSKLPVCLHGKRSTKRGKSKVFIIKTDYLEIKSLLGFWYHLACPIFNVNEHVFLDLSFGQEWMFALRMWLKVRFCRPINSRCWTWRYINIFVTDRTNSTCSTCVWILLQHVVEVFYFNKGFWFPSSLSRCYRFSFSVSVNSSIIGQQ